LFAVPLFSQSGYKDLLIQIHVRHEVIVKNVSVDAQVEIPAKLFRYFSSGEAYQRKAAEELKRKPRNVNMIVLI
jgi:hypothetical protein